MPTRAQLRRYYRAGVADARAHGETDILTFTQYVAAYRLWVTMANTDRGGNVRL